MYKYRQFGFNNLTFQLIPKNIQYKGVTFTHAGLIELSCEMNYLKNYFGINRKLCHKKLKHISHNKSLIFKQFV